MVVMMVVWCDQKASHSHLGRGGLGADWVQRNGSGGEGRGRPVVPAPSRLHFWLMWLADGRDAFSY